MSALHSVAIRMGARGVMLRLTGPTCSHQRRVTYQQMAGMLRKLRAEGHAQVPGIPEREYGVILMAAPCGGLAVTLTGKGAPIVGRASMDDLERVESAMRASASEVAA